MLGRVRIFVCKIVMMVIVPFLFFALRSGSRTASLTAQLLMILVVLVIVDRR